MPNIKIYPCTKTDTITEYFMFELYSRKLPLVMRWIKIVLTLIIEGNHIKNIA